MQPQLKALKNKHFMMTSSNGNIFRVTGHLCGEFTGHRWIPRTKASDTELDAFFDLRPNKRLNKQSEGWWFETPQRSLWHHCNVTAAWLRSLHTLRDFVRKLQIKFLIENIPSSKEWNHFMNEKQPTKCAIVYGSSQWGTTLRCNAGSHWLVPYTDWFLRWMGVINSLSSNELQSMVNYIVRSLSQLINANVRLLNTLRPRQNGRHHANDIFKFIFLIYNYCILIKISLKLFPKVGLIINQH